MTLETILRTILHAIAWSALVAFCGVVAGVGVRWMLRMLRHALVETGRRRGKWAAMTLVCLALVCGVVAQKANTNDAPDGVSAPPPMMSGAMGTIAPPVDWAQSPSGAQSSLVGSLSPGAQSSRLRERPANAQDVEAWKLRGAYDDAIRIPAMGWDFRTPDGFVEGMTVFSRGEFRPDVGHLYFPRPFTSDLAFLPQSKWDMLQIGEESKLWYAATPSNSLLVTWVNGLIDRNPLTPTNFQAEFFPDGSYEYRYGDRSLPREPVVLPFDRDGDGLENTVDPDPETAGPDAHNTNDEWKRIVCSNLYEEVEGEEGGLVWKSDVNAAAYYFVDVVAEHGPTPIYFNAGDDGGHLGSPVVVAMQGVTNHIPLLIGATYSVTSDVPFSVSIPEDGYATVETNDVLNLTISWPLDFWFMEAGEGSHAFYVGCGPVDPGGIFVWDWEIDAGGSGGPSLMGASPEWSRCFVGSSTYVWADCGTGNCGCGGCYATGTYEYEGRICTVAGGWCGCYPHPSDDDGDDPPPPYYDPPTLSCSFSQRVVFFEDAYTNAPGEVVARQSDTTTLEVVAYGGDDGGTLTVDVSNLEKLEQLTALAFPYTLAVARHQEVTLSVSFKGLKASAAENDIVATATFGALSKTAEATAVKIKTETEVDEPPWKQRKKVGVGELVNVVITPEIDGLSFSCAGGTFNWLDWQYEASHLQGTGVLTINGGGGSHVITFPTYEPAGFYASAIAGQTFENLNGEAGNFSGDIILHVMPTNVSFSRLKFMEVGCAAVNVQRYFTNSFCADWLTHVGNGADSWYDLKMPWNGCTDHVGMPPLPQPWRDGGSFTWPVPNVWCFEGESGVTNFIPHSASFDQRFELDADGTSRVLKHDSIIERDVMNYKFYTHCPGED